MVYNSFSKSSGIDSTWPSSSQALNTSRQAPVLMKWTISSCSGHKLQHIWCYGCFLTIELTSVDGPFPCMTADLMRKKKLLWRKARVPFPDLGSSKLCRTLLKSPLSKSLSLTVNVLKREGKLQKTLASKEPLKSMKTELFFFLIPFSSLTELPIT